VALLTGAIVVSVEPTIGSEIALVLLSEVFTCCCFGGVALSGAACCVADDDVDMADVCDVATDDAKGGLTVFAIPHKRDSVVLTTLRLGLLGSHIFALSSGDIWLLGELLLLLPAACGGEDDGNCCANT
jgi:hypothetical protein